MNTNTTQSNSANLKAKQLIVNGNTYPALSSVIRREVNGFIAEGTSIFPRVEDCIHFHYESINYNYLQICLADGATSPSLSNEIKFTIPTPENKSTEKPAFCVKVTCKNISWGVRRSVEHFEILDTWLHECIFERSKSSLPVLNAKELHAKSFNKTYDELNSYLTLLSGLSDGNQITCAPILHWFECDNRGRNLKVPHALGDVADINIPAIAAASVVRRYVAKEDDELDLEVGDIVSIIEMGESGWWRGKKEWRVGSFPTQCVRKISSSSDVASMGKSEVSSVTATPQKNSFGTKPKTSILRKKNHNQSNKDQQGVFGTDLCKLLSRTQEEIPAVVTDCTRFVEKHGIVDGIYRISGVSSQIRQLRHEFDQGEKRVDLESELRGSVGNRGITGLSYEGNIICDPHSVAGLCKRYFRDLPNPLITYDLYDKFADAVTMIKDDEKRLIKVHDAIQQLPLPHYRTLKHIINHLRIMASLHHVTSMHARNLAIVWAPNLLRSREIENGKLGPSAFDAARVQSVVAEYLIINQELLFDERIDAIQFCTNLKPRRPQSLMLPPKLISLEKAQELSKSGKLSGSLNSSELLNQSEVTSPPVNPSVKYRDHDKNKPHERRRRGIKSKTFSLMISSSHHHDSSASPPCDIIKSPNFLSVTSQSGKAHQDCRERAHTEMGYDKSVSATSKWKVKFGRFWKRSNGINERRNSLRRTKSDDSLVSSRHSSTQQLNNNKGSVVKQPASKLVAKQQQQPSSCNGDEKQETEKASKPKLRHYSSKSMDNTLDYDVIINRKPPRPHATFFFESPVLDSSPKTTEDEEVQPTVNGDDLDESDFFLPTVMENGLDFDPMSFSTNDLSGYVNGKRSVSTAEEVNFIDANDADETSSKICRVEARPFTASMQNSRLQQLNVNSNNSNRVSTASSLAPEDDSIRKSVLEVSAENVNDETKKFKAWKVPLSSNPEIYSMSDDVTINDENSAPLPPHNANKKTKKFFPNFSTTLRFRGKNRGDHPGSIQRPVSYNNFLNQLHTVGVSPKLQQRRMSCHDLISNVFSSTHNNKNSRQSIESIDNLSEENMFDEDSSKNDEVASVELEKEETSDVTSSPASIKSDKSLEEDKLEVDDLQADVKSVEVAEEVSRPSTPLQEDKVAECTDTEPSPEKSERSRNFVRDSPQRKPTRLASTAENFKMLVTSRTNTMRIKKRLNTNGCGINSTWSARNTEKSSRPTAQQLFDTRAKTQTTTNGSNSSSLTQCYALFPASKSKLLKRRSSVLFSRPNSKSHDSKSAVSRLLGNGKQKTSPKALSFAPKTASYNYHSRSSSVDLTGSSYSFKNSKPKFPTLTRRSSKSRMMSSPSKAPDAEQKRDRRLSVGCDVTSKHLQSSGAFDSEAQKTCGILDDVLKVFDEENEDEVQQPVVSTIEN